MQVRIDKSFRKDVKKVTDKRVLKRIALIIRQVQQAEDISRINNIKKLTGSKDHYRIRIGDYRVGLIISENSVDFIRFLHRRDIYKFFPK
jgi:mRNA interferase RelE/StbE